MRAMTDTPPIAAGQIYRSILCGVDGSRPSREAARQAAVLAGEDAALVYVAVSWEQGVGATAVATLNHKHAQECLRQARDDARELGVKTIAMEEQGDDPARRLTELAGGHDLLVLGMLGHSRAGGIMVGSAASAALHRSPVPVLVARRPPDGIDFPSRILLASDGAPRSDAAAEQTAQLAARFGSQVAIVAAREHEAPQRHGLAEQAARIIALTGAEPAILDVPGPPHRVVAAAARDFAAALVVTGSRGLSGVGALKSASERIAHAAPCSVLVVRPAQSDG
jgi:nucleotide-binding universal stress UspA family protein